VGTPTSLPKQPMQIGWICLDTQILFDHLQLIVQHSCGVLFPNESVFLNQAVERMIQRLTHKHSHLLHS